MLAIVIFNVGHMAQKEALAVLQVPFEEATTEVATTDCRKGMLPLQVTKSGTHLRKMPRNMRILEVSSGGFS